MQANGVQEATKTHGHSVRLQHVEHAQYMFSKWQGQFEQLTRGRIDGVFQRSRGNLLEVKSIKVNQRVQLRGRELAGYFTVFPITVTNAASIWQGRELQPGQMVINSVDIEVDHCSSRVYESMGLSLPFSYLENAAQALLNSHEITLPRTWAAITPHSESLLKLQLLMKLMLDTGLSNPALLRTPEFHLTEDRIIRSLVAVLRSKIAFLNDCPIANRSHIVKRAEEFMRSRMANPAGAIEICKELGVSDRTLRLAFQEHYGLGPIAYFKAIRLNVVRAQLLSDTESSVTDVARNNGFQHLGNFSSDYFRLFGELPSITMRNRRSISLT